MARRKSVRSMRAAAYNAGAFPPGSPGSEITLDQLRAGQSKHRRRSVLEPPEGGEEVKPMARKNNPGSNPQKPKPKPAPAPTK
jgi:hypothetical protein